MRLKEVCSISLVFISILGAAFSINSCTKGNNEGGDERRRDRNGVKSGRRLFVFTQSAAELAHERADFLANTQIQVENGGQYVLNTHLSVYRQQVVSPTLFGYVSDTDKVSFSAAFPPAFRENIPQEIKDEISNRDIDTLDIFFTPQEYDGTGFKPHCWLAGDRMRAVPFAGYIYQGNALVGIYQPDVNIERDIRINQLVRFDFSVHDNTLSPPRPNFNIQPGVMYNFSFWSLVIDESRRRAAATLHWILRADLNGAIANTIQGSFVGGHNTMHHLVETLNIDPRFAHSQVLPKLQHLVR